MDAQRRALIYCSAGTRIAELSWLSDLSGTYGIDIAISYYADTPYEQPVFCKYFQRNKDFKFPNFLKLASEYPDVFNYDIYLFIDDDIIVTPAALAAWVSIAREQQLDVSQPALSADSKTDWPHVRSQELGTDASQFIEIQCFALSRRTLQIALPYFFMVKTGTGLDIALFHLSRKLGWRTGVLHQISVTHPFRPEDQTVRRQYSGFSEFNQQMTRFMSFCFEFDPESELDALSTASRVLGDTRPGTVRTIAIIRFVWNRLVRLMGKVFRP
jgi:hypothetical protein